MLKSILDDIRQNFNIGNMVAKLIIVNVIVYVVCALLSAFSAVYPFQTLIVDNLGLKGDLLHLIYKPWTLITNMFLHLGFFHILWNMVGLNLFGRITGDLLGDNKILPLYLLGGLVAALVYIVSYQLIGRISLYDAAYGASGAVMAIVMVAGMIAPDYIVRLLLIGDVKIKYLVFAFIFFDIIGTQGLNSGGHFGHLGGAFAGLMYITLYKRGYDLLTPFNFVINFFTTREVPKTNYSRQKSPLTVVHRGGSRAGVFHESDEDGFQEKLDKILDKIKQVGYEQLSKEEKEFLKEASKKS
jgi:membrane associated rhomboid family serine protease